MEHEELATIIHHYTHAPPQHLLASCLLASSSETRFRLSHCPAKLLALRAKHGTYDPFRFDQRMDQDSGLLEATTTTWRVQLARQGGVYDVLREVLLQTGGGNTWYAHASQLLSPFCISLATKKEFMQALCRENRKQGVAETIAISEEWLRKDDRSRNISRMLSGDGTLALLAGEIVSPLVFHCIVLHPFLADDNLMLAFNADGAHRIASEVLRMQAWVNSKRLEELDMFLDQLLVANRAYQINLQEHSSQMITILEKWLRSAIEAEGDARLHSLNLFGSLALGTTIVGGDMDLIAVVDAAKPSSVLVRTIKKALQESAPPWMQEGSLRCFEDARAPVLSFEITTQSSENCVEAEQKLQQVLQRFGFSSVQVNRGNLSIDLTFEDSYTAFASLTTQLERDMINYGNECARKVLIWLKYWTKTVGINDKKNGTLSSFAWRLIALSHLMNCNVVPCLREGMMSVSNPPRIAGVNIWRRQSVFFGWQQSLSAPSCVLKSLVGVLRSCCVEPPPGRRTNSTPTPLFQVVSTDPAALDELIDNMLPQAGLRSDAAEIASSLQPDDVDTKHFILLALSFGSRKQAIFSALRDHFGPVSRLLDFEDTSTDDEHWRHVLGEVLDTMSQPGVRLLFIKAVPNRNLLSKLGKLLSRESSMVCFHQVLGDVARSVQPLAQLYNVLHTNEQRRRRRGKAGVYVNCPGGMSLWPDCVTPEWCEDVWKDESHGIVGAFARIRKKQNTIKDFRQLVNTSPLSIHEVRFYGTPSPEVAKASLDVTHILSRKSITTHALRSQVTNLMGGLKAGDGVFQEALALQREPRDIAEELAAKVKELLNMEV